MRRRTNGRVVNGVCAMSKWFMRAVSFEVGKTMRKSLVSVRGKSDVEEEVWLANVLVLFRCTVGGRDEKRDLAFLLYMECLASLENGDKTLK